MRRQYKLVIVVDEEWDEEEEGESLHSIMRDLEDYVYEMLQSRGIEPSTKLDAGL